MKKETNPARELAKKRWENTTAQQRKEATRKATEARWGKKDAIELSTPLKK